VNSLQRLVRDAYFSVDRRVLGCFRIAYGSVLLYDLTRRTCELTLLYSNDGVLANHFLLYAPQSPFQFSIYMAFSTPFEVGVAFALTGLVYLAYTLGFCTRIAQILALICLTSLNQRNLFFEDGGMSTTIALGLWTLFLPLGERCSIDALRRDAALPGVGARASVRRCLSAKVSSLAVAAIILQIVAIYCLNVAHKVGPTWRAGSAVHYVLWQNRVNTQIGNWLAYHEPGWLSPLSTRMTMVTEALIPVLVLLPVFRTYTRSLAFVLALGLHGGIALVMTLGPFSYAMLALMSLMIPAEVLERAAKLIPRLWLRRLYRLRARSVRTLARLSSARKVRVASSPALLSWRRIARFVREATIALLILISATEVAQDNRALRHFVQVQQPPPFGTFIAYSRMIQSWNMFAPDAPREDGMLVLDAVMQSGEHIDPFTGRAPDFELGVFHPVPESVMQCDYFFAMRVGNERYRGQLTNYLMRWHTLHGRPDRQRIVKFDVWWTTHSSPEMGSTKPGEVRREIIFSGP
jgi:hypothetical protein